MWLIFSESLLKYGQLVSYAMKVVLYKDFATI